MLKPADEHLRLVFLTGVSKFTKVSIFSELNNLMDMPMLEPVAAEDATFIGFDISQIGIVPILFQTGYLTVKSKTVVKYYEKYRDANSQILLLAVAFTEKAVSCRMEKI